MVQFMDKARILLYANHSIMKYKNTYYAKMINFIDFLALLAGFDQKYHLIVPCRHLTQNPESRYPEIRIPVEITEARYYESDIQAIFASFINALKIRKRIKCHIQKGEKVLIGGGAPNSFLFWISLICPGNVHFIFFIRGDTLKTVQHIYKNTMMYPVVTLLTKLFHKRIIDLSTRKRAIVFLFGERLKPVYPIHEDQLHVISPLINTDFINREKRREIPEDRSLRVLFVGRLSEEKNVISLLQACHRMKDLPHRFHLGIAGFGPAETALKDYIREHRLDDHVSFHGYVPHGDALKSLYDGYDILCLPSYTEGIPRVVIEAMARAMPVVATPVGSLPTLFPETLHFIEGYDSASIEHSLIWCSENRKRLFRMGEEAQKGITPFIVEKNAEKVHKIIQDYIASVQ